jgi:hypothetical protein
MRFRRTNVAAQTESALFALDNAQIRTLAAHDLTALTLARSVLGGTNNAASQ